MNGRAAVDRCRMKEGSSAYSAQRQGVWGFIPLRRRRPAGAPTTLHYTCYKVGMREGWKLMVLGYFLVVCRALSTSR